ncbi:MAG TPA: hypothetical protein VFU40_04995 [Gemmatimonadales bacterium]|nr:hypothetical protein [Gemmatimonadales bacterium]
MFNPSRWVTGLTTLGAALSLAGCTSDPTSSIPSSTQVPSALNASTGNEAPSGAHYTLNIIGVPKDKSPNLTGGSGHRIFVDLGKTGEPAPTRINLIEGDFAVTDANGTDGIAGFQLPNPDPDLNGTTSYSVYVRARGKPGGKATMQSCYEDTTGTWCAANFVGGVEPITIQRTKGGVAKFINVSKDLLFVDFCTQWDITGTICLNFDQISLFSDKDLLYYWSYDNEGLKLAQLRFYEVPTEVTF